MSFIVGLTFGPQRDRSALAVIEETEDDRFQVRHLERRRDDSYPGLIARLEALIPRLPLKKEFATASLAVDATEMGRPVVEMIRHAKTHSNIYGITVTGGDTEVKEGWQTRLGCPPTRCSIGIVKERDDE